jgi:peptidoglycan hydrolase-like protein with peptidoglycan-binding domain
MLRIEAATVRPTSLSAAAPSGLAVGMLAAVLMLCLSGTSLAAGGPSGGEPQTKPAGSSQARSSSGLLDRGAGYAVEGGSRPVRQLQRLLRRAAYPPGPVDGLFGPLTEGLVRRFQQAHGLAVDGVVGPQTRAAMRATSSRQGPHPVRPVAGYGSPGGSQLVRVIQRMLRSLGYESGPVDGVLGPQTQAAVQWFQVKRGLRPSGVVDPGTLRRLRVLSRGKPRISDAAPSSALGAPPLPSAGWHGRPIRNPHTHSRPVSSRRGGAARALRPGAGYRSPGGSQRVRRIQRTLHRLGYECGPVDGLFGPQTKASVQWFQMKHGFDPSGIIDSATLGHLSAQASGKAPTQPARDTAKTSAPPSRGKGAQPVRAKDPAPRSRAPRQARASSRSRPGPRHDKDEPGSADKPLLLALLGALGAIALSLLTMAVRGRRRHDAAAAGDGVVDGQDRLAAGKPSRPRPPRTPQSEQKLGVEMASAPPAAETSKSMTAAPPTAAPPERGADSTRSPCVVGYAIGGNRDELERQAAAIERACRERGWTLASVVRDHGSPEPKPLKRPGLAHTLKQLREGSGARLVVDRIEHVGRSDAELTALLHWCARNDVELVALDVGLDTSTHEGQLAAGRLLAVGNGQNEMPKASARHSKRPARRDGEPPSRP